jgi:hypothetical protein
MACVTINDEYGSKKDEVGSTCFGVFPSIKMENVKKYRVRQKNPAVSGK